MGQKVRPTGFRTGIMTDWQSAWFANKQDFAELLLEDHSIRRFIYSYLTRTKERKEQRPGIAKIRIERTRERVTVFVFSSRIGAIIGKKGEKIDKMTKALEIVGQYGSPAVINTMTIAGGRQVNLEVRILEAQRDAGRQLGISWRGSAGSSGASWV